MNSSFKDRDLDGLRSAYEAHADAVFTFCAQLAGNRQDAEDLAAETFLHASHSLARFEGRSSLRTYLFRIALNRWRAYLRRRKTTLILDPDLAAADAGFLESIALGEALEKLSNKHREALILVKGHGFSYRDASTVLRVPLGTVQSRVFEAVKQMRGHLAAVEPSPNFPLETQL